MKILPTFIFATISVSLLSIIFHYSPSYSPLLYFLSGAKDFKILQSDTHKIGNMEVKDISAINFSKVLKIRIIKNIDEKIAERHLQETIGNLESLFISMPAPYPGALTREIVCPEEFIPLKIKKSIGGSELIYYILYSNERFGYGVCSRDFIEYKSIVAFSYCYKTKEFFEIKLFSSIDSFEEDDIFLIESFRCPS